MHGIVMYLQLGVANHAVAQSVKQSVSRAPSPGVPSVGMPHIDRETNFVGEGVQLQEIKLPFQV